MNAPELARTSDDFTRAGEAADYVRSRTTLTPKIALVLGSGLGSFADQLAGAIRIPYSDIPHFPKPTAEGHAGQLVIGYMPSDRSASASAATPHSDAVPVACMQGRVHFYEGYTLRDVVFPVRVFVRLGINALVLTNAAGGVNQSYRQGCLVVLRDHINLQASSPLIGPNDDRLGPRFLDLTHAYDTTFREIAVREGNRLGMDIYEGVYAAVTGPSYETPAEIRMMRTLGADVVGMSTVAETVAARHAGLRVLAISCVTNLAAGILDRPLSHQEVLETGERVKGKFMELLQAVVPQLARAAA